MSVTRVHKNGGNQRKKVRNWWMLEEDRKGKRELTKQNMADMFMNGELNRDSYVWHKELTKNKWEKLYKTSVFPKLQGILILY